VRLDALLHGGDSSGGARGASGSILLQRDICRNHGARAAAGPGVLLCLALGALEPARACRVAVVAAEVRAAKGTTVAVKAVAMAVRSVAMRTVAVRAVAMRAVSMVPAKGAAKGTAEGAAEGTAVVALRTVARKAVVVMAAVKAVQAPVMSTVAMAVAVVAVPAALAGLALALLGRRGVLSGRGRGAGRDAGKG